MIDVQWAWAAGLFEGEGCITRQRNNINLVLTTTDEDVIRRWWGIVGAGRLYGPYPPKRAGKPLFRCMISRRDEVLRVYEAFEWMLGARRRERFAELWAQCPPPPPPLSEILARAANPK